MEALREKDSDMVSALFDVPAKSTRNATHTTRVQYLKTILKRK